MLMSTASYAFMSPEIEPTGHSQCVSVWRQRFMDSRTI